MTGARATLADVAAFAAEGLTDLCTVAGAAREALLRAFAHRDIEAIRVVARRAGSFLDRAENRFSHPAEDLPGADPRWGPCTRLPGESGYCPVHDPALAAERGHAGGHARSSGIREQRQRVAQERVAGKLGTLEGPRGKAAPMPPSSVPATCLQYRYALLPQPRVPSLPPGAVHGRGMPEGSRRAVDAEPGIDAIRVRPGHPEERHRP
jgi:hypothetical protein